MSTQGLAARITSSMLTLHTMATLQCPTTAMLQLRVDQQTATAMYPQDHLLVHRSLYALRIHADSISLGTLRLMGFVDGTRASIECWMTVVDEYTHHG